MTAATPSTALATVQPVFTDAGRLALAGFLAGYRGLTREACTLDLRQFTNWCRTRSLPLFSVRRAGIEIFARELEARGRARATVTRRLCTIAGFCKYAVEEELLEHSPAAHVHRPRLDYEPHATALDRNELGALLAAAGLVCLLALNGLRVPEATGADTGHLGLERGRRTLVITREGGKAVTIPLAPRAARAVDLATGGRTERAAVVTGDGRRLDRHGAAQIVRRVTRSAGIAKHVSPHTLRPTPARAPPCARTEPGPAWTGMPPTSSPRSSPVLRGNTSLIVLAWPPGCGQARTTARMRRFTARQAPAQCPHFP